ncbi:alpha/beta hydrolase [Actinoplanes sp. NPDC023801]|uniref:alpha/beta fold hydrolase n=1 Tax=Actinoplanes sp. NPDC023801 TaxID=3154595 RepID=UPI003409BFF2
MTQRRRRRFIAITASLAVLLVVGAFVDPTGGPSPRERLLPGIELDLRTAHTTRGPVQYDLTGGSWPTVLTVHGGLGGADQGRLFADWLRADGFRVLSASRPGYLDTPLDSGRTLEDQADLLAALLDELAVTRVILFAVSSGGPVAYTFAARHPARVSALVVVAGVSRADPGAGNGSAVRRVFVDTVGQRIAQVTAAVSLSSVLSGTLDETSTFTAAKKEQRVEEIMRDDTVRAFFEAMVRTTFPYRLRMPGTRNDAEQRRDMNLPFDRITAPALIVHGTSDGDVPFTDGTEAASRIGAAQHHWMLEEDHLGFWLGPGRIPAQDAVREFLRQAVAR